MRLPENINVSYPWGRHAAVYTGFGPGGYEFKIERRVKRDPNTTGAVNCGWRAWRKGWLTVYGNTLTELAARLKHAEHDPECPPVSTGPRIF